VTRGEAVTEMPEGLPATEAFIGLGSNLASPDRQLASALESLAALPNTRLREVSSFYRTAPVGYAGQPDFVNAVVRIETALAPRALLDALLDIERRHGRVREMPNGPRTLDLDLLIYGDRRHHEDGLTVPHPRMHERAFVMVPLAEIAPERDVAGRGTARELAESLAREQRVERIAR
jgi:2-amino-4-hydroxy-6-hydroxymethyldihydropteridine diphosphokinase